MRVGWLALTFRRALFTTFDLNSCAGIDLGGSSCGLGSGIDPGDAARTGARIDSGTKAKSSRLCSTMFSECHSEPRARAQHTEL